MKRFVFVAAVVALVFAAGGAASAPTPKQIAAAHERAAGQKAEKLLRQIPLPANARPTRAAPAVLREQGWCPTNTWFKCRTRFWRLRKPVATVTSFVNRHAVPGYEIGPTGDFLGRDSWYELAVVRQGAWTFVRIDAAVPWFYPRSPHEVVPSTVREIDIHGAGIDRTVTNQRHVRQLIRWFDRLDAVMPGLVCGPTGGGPPPPPATFSFRMADHTPVASAVVPSWPASDCDSIAFAIGGKAQRPLKDFGGGWSESAKGAFITRVRNLVDGPKPRAVREAQRLLDAYVPPPGAVRLGIHAVPKGSHLPYGAPRGIFGKRVERHRIRRVHLPIKTFQSYFYERLHDWRGSGGWYSSSQPDGVVTRVEADFGSVGFGGRAIGRQLNLVAVDAGAGWSLLRADVVVVWHLSVAQRANLPVGIRTIDVRGPRGKAAVTKRDRVRTIIRWFNGFQLDEPPFFAGSCAPTGPLHSYTFTFQGRHGTVARASVPASSGGCTPATYTIHGRGQTSLIAGGIDHRVRHLLGVRLG